MKKLWVLLTVLTILALMTACDFSVDPDDRKEEETVSLDGVTFSDAVFVYDGEEKRLELENLPEGCTAVYEGNTATNAGVYPATATVKDSSGKELQTFSATLTVEPAPCPMRVMFYDTTVDYTGKPITVEARTPAEFLTITYEGNGMTEPGVYTVTAHFASTDPNYLPPESKTITVTVRYVELPTEGLILIREGSDYTVKGYTGTAKEVVIPAAIRGTKITKIDADAFAGNKQITSVAIRDHVTNIGARAFDGCTSLASVTLGEGLINIGSFAFRGCASLTDIVLPKGLSTVGKSIFADTPLVSLTTPFIGGSALSTKHYLGYFFGASSYQENELYVPSTLKNVTVSSGIDYSLPANAFSLCKDLERVLLTDGVTEVCNCAFSDCTSLSLVYFGGNVQSVPANEIGYYSPFYHCSQDLRICLSNTEKPSGFGMYWNYISLFTALSPEYGVELSLLS